MKFENEFSVDAPIEEVWQTMLDLEKVAPAMPGAEVTEKVDDDNYKVAIKVKVGPMTMNYKGDVAIADKDPAAHSAKMNVKVREARGQGNATAEVTTKLDEEGGRSHARIDADVKLAGKAAAMGRGLIEDVSSKLVDQFANNLEQMLSAGPEPAAEAARSTQEEPQKFERQDSIDAFALAGEATGDKLKDPKVVGGALVVLLLILWRITRR